MKKYASTIILILVFLLGGGLLLYPIVSDYWNSRHQSGAIAGYEAGVKHMSDSDYTELMQAAQEYNAALPDREGRLHPTPEENVYYRSLLRTENSDMMASIEIPSIHVWLPVYHGTDESVLQTGVGHVEGSSLPIGGASVHTVLSGHRGLPSAKLFSDLNKVKEGDSFRIHVLGQILTYQVDQISVVEPQQVETLAIEPGKDYCTLVTCTPYGINSHRLLVRGARVEMAELSDRSDETLDQRSTAAGSSETAMTRDWSWLPYVASAGFLFVILVLLLLKSFKRERGKRERSEEEDGFYEENK